MKIPLSISVSGIISALARWWRGGDLIPPPAPDAEKGMADATASVDEQIDKGRAEPMISHHEHFVVAIDTDGRLSDFKP